MHASHKLNVVSSARPVKQRVRRSHLDRHQIIQAEVDNLLKVGFTREVEYPEWLANVVVVPKKGGKWRVCIDYTNLNDACSKDSFPILRIHQIVDASAGHGMLSFLDAFSGYQTGAGIGLQLKSPTGERIEQAIQLGFNASNNES